jgi:hypothetical protein
MDKQRKEEIIKLLTEKGAVQRCPRCLNPQFELVGEASVQPNLEVGARGVSHPTMPVIVRRPRGSKEAVMTPPGGSSRTSTYWSWPRLVKMPLDAVAVSSIDLCTATPDAVTPRCGLCSADTRQGSARRSRFSHPSD